MSTIILAARIKLTSENINNSRLNLNWPKWQWLMSMYFRRFIQTMRNLRIIKFIVVLNVFRHFFLFYQVNAFIFGCIELETIFIVWHFWQLLIVLNKEQNRSFNVREREREKSSVNSKTAVSVWYFSSHDKAKSSNQWIYLGWTFYTILKHRKISIEITNFVTMSQN